MSLMVLGKPFRITERLAFLGELTQIFLAEDFAGRKVILKCHADPDLFFDELARYYSCGDSKHIARVLYNYPPFCVSGNPFAFQKEIAKRFGIDNPLDDDGEPTPEALRSVLAMAGVLVLEYLEGEPFTNLLAEQSPAELHYYLDELTEALCELHDFGEYHGNLTPANIMIDRERRHLWLLGLAFSPKREDSPIGASPEHGSELRTAVGPASDIYMLGRNFLWDLPEITPGLSRLRVDCLKARPDARPNIREVRMRMGFVNSPELESSRPVRARRRKLNFKWAAVASIVLVSAMGITITKVDPFWNLRDSLLAIADHEPDRAIQGLVEMRESYREHHVTLAEAIAMTKIERPNYKVGMLDPRDLTKPVAVFSFDAMPVLVGRDQHFSLGDWVEINGAQGYLSQINSRYVQVQFDQGPQTYPFERPDFNVLQSMNQPGVMVWGHEESLSRLIESLRGLPALMNEEAAVVNMDSPLTDLFRRRDTPIEVSSAPLRGFYQAENLTTFIAALTSQLSITSQDDVLKVEQAEDNLPVHVTFDYFTTANRSVASLCRMLTHAYGIPFEASEAYQNQRLADRHFQHTNWRQILDDLGLPWFINEVDGVPKVMISDLDPGR